ncbi:MAG: HPr family phosphocarrier protein [Oceanococcaceae bacterium]
MLSRDLTIINKLGLHARAAARLVQTASNFSCDITLHTPQRSANAKSIMGILMLAAAQGHVITVQARGEDADAALDALAGLVAARFGEEA